MIGAHGEGRRWARAALLSAAVHAAAAGWLIWRPSLDFARSADTPDQPVQVQITALPPPAPAEAPPAIDMTASPDPASIAPPAEAHSEAVLTPLGPNTAAGAQAAGTPPLLNVADPALLALDAAPAAGPAGGPAAPEPAADTAAPPAEAAPLDPQLATLIERLRARLAEPCLLALPAPRAEGGAQLNVLADNDRGIAGLMDAVTGGLGAEVTRRAVLVDPRQCPALSFARRDPRYPVPGLALQLDSADLRGGASLRGSITGGTGRYTTLLLIDDNGAVHDLRRFVTSSAGIMRIDVPITHLGRPRDTHQLLLALATPARPRTLQRAGEAAGPFFDALFAEVGQDALIGIAPVYVR